MEGCGVFYVDTASDGFLLHVLIYRVHTWISILHLAICEASAREGVRCNVAPGVHSPSLEQARSPRLVAQLA